VRVVHFLQYFSPAIGGGVKFVVETGGRLCKRGHSVDVISSTALENVGFMNRRVWKNHHYSGPKLGLERGIRVWRYNPLFLPAMDHIPFLTYGPILPGLLSDFRRIEADLVHTSAFPYAHNSLAWLTSRAKRIPLVVTPYFKPGLPVSRIHRRVLKAARRILVPVRWEKNEICRRFGIDPAVVDIVPSGVDHHIYHPKKERIDERYILFVGRLTEAKGVGHLVQAFREYILPRYPDLRLVIVGWVSDWARRALPLHEDSVVIKGPVTNELELARLYASSEVVCYPSRDDCFPHVFLEAWSAGRPVVGCPIGGVSKVIEDYKDGLFARFGDPRSIASKLEVLLDDPKLATKMGRRGREKILRSYTWEKVTDLLERSYLDATH